MNIKYMQEFIELSRSRNITQTAEALFISQPSLSRHMVLLEEELGVQLLRRSKKGVELTDNGRIALEEFKNMVYQYNQLLDKFAAANEGITGELNIGLPYYAVSQYLAPVLRSFGKRYPKIRVRTTSAHVDPLLYYLLEESVDVAFFALNDQQITGHPGMVFRKLADDPLTVLCDPNHPLAKDTISISELFGQKLIWMKSDTNMAQNEFNQYVRNILRDYSVAYQDAGSFENIDFLTWSLLDTQSLIIFPKHIAEHHPRLKCMEIKEKCSVGIYAGAMAANHNPAVPLFMDSVSHEFILKERI